MGETDEKFIIKDLVCPLPNCGHKNRVAIVEEGQVLSERYQTMLRGAGVRITKQGALIHCHGSNCSHKIKVD